jgi:hypothetical protein
MYMQITATTRFIVTDKETGKKYYPKGVYWTGKNNRDLVIVGDTTKNHTIRWKVKADEADVEVI